MRLRWPALLLVALIALVGAIGTWLGYPVDRAWRWLAALWILIVVFERFTVLRVPISITLEELEPCYLGKTCCWRYRLVNNHRQRLQLRFQPLPPMAFAGVLEDEDCSLAPGDAHALLFKQTAVQLGSFSWTKQPVEVRGLFGFASWVRWLPLSESGADDAGDDTDDDTDYVSVVEPAILESARERVALEQSGSRAVAMRSMGGSEFRSLRSYAPGDPPSAINWKTTARTARLMVRETEADQQLTLLFVVDCGVRSGLRIGSLDALSHAINLASRMAELANAAGDRFGLVAFAQEPLVQLAPSRGTTHHARFRRALSGLGVADAESNPLAAMLAARQLLSQRALILLVSNLDDPDAAGALQQSALILRPQHLPMVISVEDESIDELAEQRVASGSELYSSLAAQEYQRVTRRTVKQLERIGAVVVQSPPETLEKMVFERYRRLRRQHRV